MICVADLRQSWTDASRSCLWTTVVISSPLTSLHPHATDTRTRTRLCRHGYLVGNSYVKCAGRVARRWGACPVRCDSSSPCLSISSVVSNCCISHNTTHSSLIPIPPLSPSPSVSLSCFSCPSFPLITPINSVVVVEVRDHRVISPPVERG